MSPVSAPGKRPADGQRSPVLTISFAAVNAALVLVVTFFARVPISQIPGQQFNFGDIMIFIAAWTFGPAIGGFAGGVGSALSDAIVGGVYAPFTFAIKGSEGVLAGYLAKDTARRGRMFSWAAAGAVMVGGYFLTNALLIGWIFGTGSPFNPGLALALFEVPVDIAQVLSGGIVGGPVSRYLRIALPLGHSSSASLSGETH